MFEGNNPSTAESAAGIAAGRQQEAYLLLLVPSGCVSERAVSFEVPHEVFSGCFEVPANESKPQHPAPESVGFIFSLLFLRACVLDLFRQFAHGQAELDHRPELASM